MADRIVIGISGASGAPIAEALLKALKKRGYRPTWSSQEAAP